MKPGLGWAADPALHLIAASTVLLGAAMALGMQARRPHVSDRVIHPQGCHACSFCSAESIAVRDAFLIRTGSIAPTADDLGE
jgi:hypothetical protein